MNKILISLIFVLISASAIMAQSGPDNLIGINLSYGVPWYTQELGNSELSESQSMISAGMFIDAVFIRIGADYSMSYGDYKVEGNNSIFGTAEASSSKYSKTSLDLSALLKLPVDLGAVKLWGGGGIMYSINLTEEYNGNDVSDGSDLNDFYLIAAAGLDITANESVYICPALTLGYNLTPNPRDSDNSSVDYSGYMWKASIGVAMKM